MPKFFPKNPFRVYKGDGVNPGKDYAFISGIVREQINFGGVTVYAWLMEGTFDQTDQKGRPSTALDEGMEASIENGLGMGVQDVVLGENRDRKYSDDCFHLVGVYQVSQATIDFARFGSVMITNDVIQMEFHRDDMERQCGRRLIPGDVIEMPHHRDVGNDGRPRNRWYTVTSVVKSPNGYDAGYNFHVLNVTMKPMKDAQEFIDLMERTDDYGKTLRDQASNRTAMEAVTERIQQIAEEQASTTWWDDSRMYIDPDTTLVFRWTADGEPPNGLPVTKASSFPSTPTEGDYVLRVDDLPNKLYRYQQGVWVLKEVDRKREWQPYNWTARLRQHATDRSAEDNARPWQYKSVHDLLTAREDRSRPSPKNDRASDETD